MVSEIDRQSEITPTGLENGLNEGPWRYEQALAQFLGQEISLKPLGETWVVQAGGRLALLSRPQLGICADATYLQLINEKEGPLVFLDFLGIQKKEKPISLQEISVKPNERAEWHSTFELCSGGNITLKIGHDDHSVPILSLTEDKGFVEIESPAHFFRGRLILVKKSRGYQVYHYVDDNLHGEGLADAYQQFELWDVSDNRQKYYLLSDEVMREIHIKGRLEVSWLGSGQFGVELDFSNGLYDIGVNSTSSPEDLRPGRVVSQALFDPQKLVEAGRVTSWVKHYLPLEVDMLKHFKMLPFLL